MQSTNIARPAWLEIHSRWPKLLACAALLAVAYGWYFRVAWQYVGIDWHRTFYPAVVLLLAGKDPYSVATLHNPVWTLLPLVPFALLGEQWGSAAYLAFSIFSLGYVAYRLKARLWAWTAFMASLPVIYAIRMQNIDPLVMWGFILPPPAGLFLVLIKPQMGLAISVYWAWLAWRKGGLKRVLLTFMPVLAALALSFVVYGNWLSEANENLVSVPWNASLWPWSIPLGLALLYLALRYDKEKAAVSASPLLAPYLAAHSWSVVFVGLLERDAWMVAASGAVWLLYALGPLLAR